MRVHFIGIGENIICDIALAIQKKGFQITGSDYEIENSLVQKLSENNLSFEKKGWFPEKIIADLEAVVYGETIAKSNPELLKAEELGLQIYSYSEFLYELTKEKTRVVIAGSQRRMISLMVLHVLEYHEREIDYVVDNVNLTLENDFILLENNFEDLTYNSYNPNIALVSTISDGVEQFVSSLVNGGILMYNQEDENLKSIVEASDKPIKRYPYFTPEYFIEDEVIYLVTNEGDMPLEISDKENLQNFSGVQWVCQHMGIDQDDFYEAIITFTVE